ncbi:MAG: AAA family ATPase [Deltaproteobacteria bacterium]|nr:AAA family ATPase [Deltaproteobacteria bacterium]
MLRKIISVKNVGRFLNYSAAGDVELKRYNLVFAENGRGKTTLCAILRSLQSGDADLVLGRTTLGTSNVPEITILLDGGPTTFSRGVWDTTVPNLAIFDSTFVSENVYSGDAVYLDHRRNLYRLIVGKQGVSLAHQIEELNALSREKSTEIRRKRDVVQALVPHGPSVEDFLSLQEDTAIEAKIIEKTKELEAVKQADQIKSRAALSELTLPTFPTEFEVMLCKTIESIAKDTERRVTMQIEKHTMHRRGEPWLSEGLSYIRNNTCPFCEQPLDNIDLVAAYKTYFGKDYNDLRTEITALRQGIESAFGDREIARIEISLQQNAATIEFWLRYCTITPPTLANTDEVGDTLRALRQAALTLLDRKIAIPLERVEVDASFTDAHAAFVALQNDIATYNRAVQAANAAVTAKKAATSATDVRSVENALTRLQAMKRRHEADARVACQEYNTALEEKKTLEARKEKVREELDQYTQEVIAQYEQAINRMLDDFHAGFLITGTSHGYPGGVASSSYQILINDTAVELGDSSTHIDRPSFKNTLSSGDKSTLALAFFLAHLGQDSERANKIVIFDDPFNSQDNFRKDCTVQKIKQCGESCHQVLVLSHDQNFLRRIWDRLSSQAVDRKCLQLARVGVRDTRISEWDIEQATQARFVADRKALSDYYHTNKGDPRDIVSKIRPVIETHCKNIFPGDFTADALGTIIGKVRTAGATHQLFPLLNDLDALNEYTRRYHHGENPTAAAEQISDMELQGFVKKTLTITGGC